MSGQLELFRPTITVLDPRIVVGAQTAVRALFRVRYCVDGAVHLVFEDRHGTYCQEHGRDCPSVADALDSGEDTSGGTKPASVRSRRGA